MKVAEAYQNGSDTEVQVKDSATAIQNAQNIAAEIKNSGGTTDEKLEAILQKICELVSYNDEAAAASDYDMNAWGHHQGSSTMIRKPRWSAKAMPRHSSISAIRYLTPVN